MGLFEKIARDIIKQFKDDTSDSKKDNNSLLFRIPAGEQQ